MAQASLVLLTAAAFAAGPFLFPEFSGYPPDSFPVPQQNAPVQPAGYAFGIWGPIYLWLLASAAFGLWQRRGDPGWARMRPPLIVSLALGAIWLPLAQYDPLPATVVLWAMWAAGLVALFRAPQDDRALAAWPLGLYAGWLSAAACVSLGLVLAGYGLVGQRTAALAMLALAIGLAAAIQLTLRRTPTFGLAVAWALVGIHVANYPVRIDIAGLAAGGAVGIGALTLLNAVQEWRSLRACSDAEGASARMAAAAIHAPHPGRRLEGGPGRRRRRRPRGGRKRGSPYALPFFFFRCLASAPAVLSRRPRNGLSPPWPRMVSRIGVPGMSKSSRKPPTR